MRTNTSSPPLPLSVIHNPSLNHTLPSTKNLYSKITPSSSYSSSLSSNFAEAKILQVRNKISEALSIYNDILSIHSDNLDALNGKCACLRHLGDIHGALHCCDQILKIDITNWAVHVNIGLIYKESGKLTDSIISFQNAARYNAPLSSYIEPLSAALTDLGTRFKLENNNEEALKFYNEAIKINPKFSPAYFNLGVVHSEMGRIPESLKYYSAAVQHNPSHADALLNIGVLYKNAGNLESAIQFYTKSLSVNPNFNLANNNLAIALTDLGTRVKNEGRNDEAILHYKKALLYNVKYSDAWYNLGVANADAGNHDEAILSYEVAVTLNPRCSHAYNNLGVIYKDRNNIDRAISCYKTALSINPLFSQTLNNLGVMYTMLGQMDDAYSMCQKAIEVNPTYADAFNNLGVLFRDEGRIEEAIASYEACLRLDPLSKNAGQNLLLALNYLADANHNAVTESHRRWGALQIQHRGASLSKSIRNNLSVNRILRIGYISPDFFVHSVSYFIEAALAHANSERYCVYCYSNVTREDKKTSLLKSYVLPHNWRHITGMNTRAICKLIREDEIDILVELTGHTAANRLDVMTLAPAPIQVTWIGYPNTTGLPTIDYRLTDAIADPLNTEQKYIERLYRLPPPFLCYTPSHDAPNVSEAPALAPGLITFGSFNNMAKINYHVMALWSRILASVPRSRLLLKCKPFASETVRNKFLKQLEDHGLSSGRVDLLPLLPHTSEHLNSYSLLDISLDTFPYAGTTTTCESLYMGVPVVTLSGPVHAHNVGSSLISCIPMLSKLCIASSYDDYVEKAVHLASNISELNKIRLKTRKVMLESNLCNGALFTCNLEEAYRSMWINYIEKHKKINKE